MHIPDAFIPLDQAIVYWIIVIPFIALSIRWARREMDDMKIPLLAALAAGIFAIQAMNIPIGMGTSGHMVGAVLAAIILGSPWAGVLLLTLVLFVQALGFADGGVTTLGVNILNMGVISGFVGYYTFVGLKKVKLSMPIAAFGGAWLGLFISSIACSLQMTLAGIFPLVTGLAAMGTYHAIIGVIGEGAITAIAVTAITKARPDLLSQFSEEAVTA